jgi:BirA family biotin operon repressor/biotin-[acetyl-CoA-carboxylase] ligase
MELDPAGLRRMLHGPPSEGRTPAVSWSEIHYSPVMTSTQDELSRLEDEGCSEGTVVIAGSQTSGRGRYGRTWYSPPGLGIYVSTLLRPGGEPRGLVRYSLAAALAGCETIRQTGLPAEIRWPNDIVHKGRKLAGVLVESRTIGQKLRGVLIGFGINLSHREVDFPPDIAPASISLAMAMGRPPPDPTGICAAWLNRLAEWYRAARAGELHSILSRWMTLSPSSAGRAVRIWEEGHVWEASTIGLADDGALRVRLPDGTERALRHNEKIRVREVI